MGEHVQRPRGERKVSGGVAGQGPPGGGGERAAAPRLGPLQRRRFLLQAGPGLFSWPRVSRALEVGAAAGQRSAVTSKARRSWATRSSWALGQGMSCLAGTWAAPSANTELRREKGSGSSSALALSPRSNQSTVQRVQKAIGSVALTQSLHHSGPGADSVRY